MGANAVAITPWWKAAARRHPRIANGRHRQASAPPGLCIPHPEPARQTRRRFSQTISPPADWSSTFTFRTNALNVWLEVIVSGERGAVRATER